MGGWWFWGGVVLGELRMREAEVALAAGGSCLFVWLVVVLG